MRQHRIDDFHDELLAGPRQLGDAIHLLLQLGHRATLGGGFSIVTEQGFHGDAHKTKREQLSTSGPLFNPLFWAIERRNDVAVKRLGTKLRVPLQLLPALVQRNSGYLFDAVALLEQP